MSEPMPKSKKQTKLVVLVIVAVVIAVAGVAGFMIFSSDDIANTDQVEVKADPTQLASQAIAEANAYILEGDISSAVEQARKALEYTPDDLHVITAAADVIVQEDPDEAKPLYVKILEQFREESNPDENGQPLTVYWAGAKLAEQAGETELAIKYYTTVLDVADVSNEEEKGVMDRSRLRLEELR